MIDIVRLYKSYKNSEDILKNINLTINDNEVTALLGHNGSGKSTLIKCMVGVLKPTQGSAYIEGKDIFDNRKKLLKYIGVVFNQKPSFIVDLTISDNLLFFKSIYNINDEDFNKALELINTYINIENLLDKPYRKLSFGERVKCEITSVLLHSPKYIFLDEPTIGLDYNAKKGLYLLLDHYKKENHSTILITTHEVDYIEGICNRAIILSKGEVKYDGRVETVCNSLNHRATINIKFAQIIDEEKAKKIIQGASAFNKDEQTITFTCFHTEEKDRLLSDLIKAFSISSINTTSASLREVFEDVLKEIVESK